MIFEMLFDSDRKCVDDYRMVLSKQTIRDGGTSRKGQRTTQSKFVQAF
jgi:hypothetical protein